MLGSVDVESDLNPRAPLKGKRRRGAGKELSARDFVSVNDHLFRACLPDVNLTLTSGC